MREFRIGERFEYTDIFCGGHVFCEVIDRTAGTITVTENGEGAVILDVEIDGDAERAILWIYRGEAGYVYAKHDALPDRVRQNIEGCWDGKDFDWDEYQRLCDMAEYWGCEE